MGHSLSFGRADAAIVLAQSAALADAAATAVGNLVQSEEDLARAVDFVKPVEGIMGIAVIMGGKMAAWGRVNLVRRESV